MTCAGCGKSYEPKGAWMHDGSACRPPCLLPDGSYAVPHWAVVLGQVYARWTDNPSTKRMGEGARKALVEAVNTIKPLVSAPVVHANVKAVHKPQPVNKPADKDEARKAYRREWMAKRRASKKANVQA